MDHITTGELFARGVTKKAIAGAVSRGELIRVRRGHFGFPDASPSVLLAMRAGGALTCVSELRSRGIWVLDSDIVHVNVARNASRLDAQIGPIRRHWGDRPFTGGSAHVGLVEALVTARGCLQRRAWIASVDSALHLSLLSAAGFASLRSRIPEPARIDLGLVDRRAESGLESIVRVICHDLGLRVRVQVRLAGIGRVDLIVEGRIVVETDGTAFHDQALSARDRLRDARIVAAGLSVVRPGYSLIVFDQEAVARQLIGAVASHRGVPNSGRIAARARRRLHAAGFA